MLILLGRYPGNPFRMGKFSGHWIRIGNFFSSLNALAYKMGILSIRAQPAWNDQELIVSNAHFRPNTLDSLKNGKIYDHNYIMWINRLNWSLREFWQNIFNKCNHPNRVKPLSHRRIWYLYPPILWNFWHPTLCKFFICLFFLPW